MRTRALIVRTGLRAPGASQQSPMILYLAADLLWASKIKGTADAMGIAARPVRSVEMLVARLADSPVTAILLDLDKPDEAFAMLARLRGTDAGDRERRVRVLAFGPHVATELFKRARDLGAERVLARGAFERALGEILADLAGEPDQKKLAGG